MSDRNDRRIWQCRDRKLVIGGATLIMGIVNVTPDSFADGGRYRDVGPAVDHGIRLQAEGADIIDVGGESTRPSAAAISAAEEIERVVPVIRELAAKLDVPISVDTHKAAVAAEALTAGASIVNDISALRFDQKMAELVAKSGAGVVLMHIQGTPQNMQFQPHYRDLLAEIHNYLESAIANAERAGIDRAQIAVDPGIGFGKTAADNFVLIRCLRHFIDLGFPLVIGPSRKSFIGRQLDLPVDDRLEGTLAAVTASILNGADVVRVHDAKEVKRAAIIADTISGRIQVV